MNFCTECGKRRNSEDAFCAECGTKVSVKINITPKEPTLHGVSKEKTSKKLFASAIAVVLVVALVLGGLTVWDMFSDRAPDMPYVQAGNGTTTDEYTSVEICLIDNSTSAIEKDSSADANANLDISVGDTMSFGNIEWRVLDERPGQMLLLSEYVLKYRGYHYAWLDGNYNQLDITWANSEMRKWLNGEFYNRFTPEERNRIAQINVTTNDNPWFGTPGGSDTTDKIFLLSLEEVVHYFGDSRALANPRRCGDTHEIYVPAFNDQFYGNRIARNLYGEQTRWWLRSPGYTGIHAVYISCVGAVWMFGNAVMDSARGGVRPALWIKL